MCGFVVVAGAVSLSALDILLKAMHPVGAGHYGIGDLAPLFGGHSARTVVATWHAWLAGEQAAAHGATGIPGMTSADVRLISAPGVPTGPDSVAAWYLVIDVAFAFAYTAFAAGLLVWLRDTVLEADRAYYRAVSIALVLAPTLLFVELGEDSVQYGLVKGWYGLEWLTRVLTGAKFALLILIVITVAAGLLRIVWPTMTEKSLLAVHTHPPWLRALAVCRVQVALTVGFGFLLFGPGPLNDQSADAIRRLGDDGWLLPIPLAIVVAFGLVLGVSASRLLASREGYVRRQPVAPQAPVAAPGSNRSRQDSLTALVALSISGGLLLGLLIGLAKANIWHAPLGVDAGLGICAAIGLLSLPLRDAPFLPEALDETGSSPLPSILTAAPIGIIGVALLSASIGDAVYDHSKRALVVSLIGLAFLALALVTVRVFLSLFRAVTNHALLRRVATLVTIAAACLLVTIACLSPWWTAQYTNGLVGVSAGFFAVATLVLTAIVALLQRPPPGVFRVFRFRQVPVLTLFAIWLLVASLIDTNGTHAIRQGVKGETAVKSPHLFTLAEAFAQWRKEAPVFDVGGARVRPLLFVASEGGGIRAAYWTGEVLDCLVFDADPCDKLPGRPIPPRSVFAATGVSGGALGLVETVARLDNSADAGGPWVENTMGDDFLGPTAARMLFGDLPNAFLRARSPSDRAAVLEGSWERAWPKGPDGALGKGFFTRRLEFPLLMLNGTSVTDGCRFETSVLETAVSDPTSPARLGQDCRSVDFFDLPGTYVPPAGRRDWVLPATKDAGDELCTDIHMSTAALLAARFPYVTPSGRVECKEGTASSLSYVVDGGYLENSSLSTIAELWSALEPLVARANAHAGQGGARIVPLLVHIDNHYANTPAPGPGTRPKELLVPPEALASTRNGHDQDARVEAMLLFSGDITPGTKGLGRCLTDRIANLYPREHPGTEAPLGWAMSKVSRLDLARELRTQQVLVELAKARDWLAKSSGACIS